MKTYSICCAFVVVITHCGQLLAQSTQELYDVAAAHYANGAWELAEESFSSLITKHPESKLARESQFYLGEALVKLQRPHEALNAFKAFQQNFTDHANRTRCDFRIGECHFLLQQDQQALDLMQEFVFANPQHSLREFALPIIGNIRLARNEPQIAERAFKSMLTEFPESIVRNKAEFVF